MELSTPFMWGSGGQAVTEDDIARRRKLAQTLLERGTGFEPIQHWTQGLAKVANAIAGMRQNQFADEDAQAKRKADREMIAGLLTGALPAPVGGAVAGAGGQTVPSMPPDPSGAPAPSVSPAVARVASAMPAAGAPAPVVSGPPPMPPQPDNADPKVQDAWDRFTTRDGMPVAKVPGAPGQEAIAKVLAERTLPKPGANGMVQSGQPLLPPVPEAGAPGAPPAPAAVPAPTPAPVTAANPSALMPSAPLTPEGRASLVAGLTSDNPTVRALAMTQLQKLQKDPRDVILKDLEIAQARKNLAKPDATPLGEGSRLVDPATGREIVPAATVGDKMLAEAEGRKKVLTSAGIDPNSDKGKAYIATGALPKDTQKDLTASDRAFIRGQEEKVVGLDQTITKLNEAMGLNDKIATGFKARMAPGWNFVGLGNQQTEDTARFNTIMSSEAIADMSAQLKGATTDKEMNEFKTIAGDATQPPENRRKAIEGMMKRATELRTLYQQQIAEARGLDPKAAAKPAAATAPGPKADAEGWTSLPNGIRIREVK